MLSIAEQWQIFRGESLLPMPRSTHGTVSDIRHEVRAVVSEFERNVTSTVHRTIVQGQEGSGGKHPSVSNSRTLAVTECPLTVV